MKPFTIHCVTLIRIQITSIDNEIHFSDTMVSELHFLYGYKRKANHLINKVQINYMIFLGRVSILFSRVSEKSLFQTCQFNIHEFLIL